jgi:potassium-dependent mechanosensitive channel
MRRPVPAGSAPPSAISGPQANSAPDNKATVQGADSRINTVEIAQRVNQELGINLETTTAGWKRELDRLEGDLARPRLRYSDLNRFRDELLRVRSAVQEVPKASGTLFPR